ncbi:spermidine/putrescine ABC transporter ATP-binding protein PotA [soil metagenome]
MTLKIVNLCKKFDGRFVIRNVSLEVNSGEILGVFGLTSAGKTTLLKTIAGIEICDGGEIHNGERELTFVPSTAREIDFPDISNQSFWDKVFKTRKKSELADGEGQVLALEAALENTKDVILLDNSFCQMDMLLREENQQYLRQTVKEKNLIVLLASNDYEEIFQVCDRVAVLSGGEIAQIGTPREVYEQPETAEVARVFGRNNLISARRLTSNKTETQEFQTIEGSHRIFAEMHDKKSLGAINQNIFLAIRPEHISISFGASFPEDNLLKATVTDVKFLGHTTLIKLDADGLNLEAMVLRLVGLNVGDECVVGLPPDRILILKD